MITSVGTEGILSTPWATVGVRCQRSSDRAGLMVSRMSPLRWARLQLWRIYQPEVDLRDGGSSWGRAFWGRSMFLVEVRIENFRAFGEGDCAFILPLKPGLTALVGENDAGKTAVIDALRLVLGVRGQDYYRVTESDFHQPPGGCAPRTEIRVRLRFDDLLPADRSTFIEHLTYDETGKARLHLTWRATAAARGARRYINVETRSGADGDGPVLETDAKLLLCATYLRPLRDAEQALSAGRGSRLSQILQHTREVNAHGEDFHPEALSVDPSSLSVLGIGDYANHLHPAERFQKSAWCRDRSA